MKRTRFCEMSLNQAMISVKDLCGEHGLSDAISDN